MSQRRPEYFINTNVDSKLGVVSRTPPLPPSLPPSRGGYSLSLPPHLHANFAKVHALRERVRLKACKTQDLHASKCSGGPNMRVSARAFAEVNAL